MAMTDVYTPIEPTRAEVDTLQGPTVIEFGAPWCGYCQAAQALLRTAFADYPAIPHKKIEDGKGRALGRSYGVKLWPTLIFLRDGNEIARLVRPMNATVIKEAFALLG